MNIYNVVIMRRWFEDGDNDFTVYVHPCIDMDSAKARLHECYIQTRAFCEEEKLRADTYNDITGQYDLEFANTFWESGIIRSQNVYRLPRTNHKKKPAKSKLRQLMKEIG